MHRLPTGLTQSFVVRVPGIPVQCLSCAAARCPLLQLEEINSVKLENTGNFIECLEEDIVRQVTPNELLLKVPFYQFQHHFQLH